MRLCHLAVSIVFTLAALPAFAAGNVVVNGSFENHNGTLAPPWVFNGFGQSFAAGARTGSESASLAANFFGVPSLGGASQSLNLRRGGSYQLTYYIGALQFLPGAASVYTVQSSLRGKPVLSGTTTAGATVSYVEQSTRVSLKRGLTDLTLQATAASGADLSILVLDDVSLTFLHGFSIDFRKLALTANERNVADGLYASTRGTTAQTEPLFDGLSNVSHGAAPAVLDSLSGEGITATQNLAYRSAQLFNSSIFDQTTFYGPGSAGNSITLTDQLPGFSAYAPSVDTPRVPLQTSPLHELADLPSSTRPPVMPFVAPNRTWRAWATGFGGAEDIHGTAVPGSATQNNTIYGGVLGVDYQLTPNYLVGVAVGGSDGQFSVPGRTTSGSTDGGHIAFYDIATFGRFYGASSTSFSYFSNKTNRFVSGFGGLVSENERGTFASTEFRSRLEFGRHFDGYGATITPFVALELAELRSNGFNEQATSGPGNFVLNVSGQSTASVPGYIGARFQRITPIGNGMIFSPTLEIAYVHEFSPYRSQIATLVDLPGSTFLVDGARPARDAAHVKAGGELALGPRSFLFANFDGEFSGVDQFYGGKGGFRYVW